MEYLQNILLILQVVVALSLIILVLIQKSDSDSLSGIGGGSGGMNSAISSKASANVLTKFTIILIGVFMVNCLILASISNSKNKSITKELEKAAQQQEEAAPVNSQIPQVK